MPILTWPSKGLPEPNPGSLVLDSIIFPRGEGYPSASTKGSLYLGENSGVMAALLPEFEGRLDLIYADPPFFTNKRFSARIGRGEDSRHPADWQLAEGYADHWEDLDSYLNFLYARLALMVRLLAPHGTLYLHLDWHASAYARLLLDELFGAANFINEITWIYHGPSPIRRAFNRKHDTILVYVKGSNYIFNTDAVREPYNPNTVKTFGSSPRAGFGKIPDLERGKVPEDWWYFPVVARLHKERTGYPTQKPESLLERILLASSNPGSLVADFFCGSGTFPLVAARHGRHFLACDSAWRAIHTTRKRLVAEAQSPFAVIRSDESPTTGEESSFEYQLDTATSTVHLSTSGLNLDYWEVDPAWDGLKFKSAAQVQRSNRSADIPLEIKLPVVGTNIRLRAVTVDGEQIALG